MKFFDATADKTNISLKSCLHFHKKAKNAKKYYVILLQRQEKPAFVTSFFLFFSNLPVIKKNKKLNNIKKCKS